MKKLLLLIAVTAILSGCGTTKVDSLELQKVIAYKLGLASSDEVTVSNIKESEANTLGTKNVTLDAKTARNKRYACSFSVMPALTPFDKPTLSNLECKAR